MLQVTKKAAEIAAVKDDAEKDLALAKPALDAALSALNSITPKDINSLKALKNPPDVVKRIFDCVLLLRMLPVDKVRCLTPCPHHAALAVQLNTADLVMHLHASPWIPSHQPRSFIALCTQLTLLLPPAPPSQVSWQDVKGSMVILGTYSESVKMMGDMNFLSALVNFPKEQINDETVELLLPYFAAPDFNFESARKASGEGPHTGD